MYAVVSTGGKQLRVSVDDLVVVEKLDAPVGDKVEFDVLLVADGDSLAVTPAETASAKVIAEVVEHFKGDKAVVFKFKKRKGYKKLRGHRQELTKVRIMDVSTQAPKKSSRKTAKKEIDESVETEETPVAVDETPTTEAVEAV